MTARGLSLGTLALLTLLATDNAHAQTVQGYGLLGGGSYSNQFGSGRLSAIAGGADVLIARGFGVGMSATNSRFMKIKRQSRGLLMSRSTCAGKRR